MYPVPVSVQPFSHIQVCLWLSFLNNGLSFKNNNLKTKQNKWNIWQHKPTRWKTMSYNDFYWYIIVHTVLVSFWWHTRDPHFCVYFIIYLFVEKKLKNHWLSNNQILRHKGIHITNYVLIILRSNQILFY